MFKIAKCSSAAMSNGCKYYANLWIILKPQFKPEEGQEMDTGYYWKWSFNTPKSIACMLDEKIVWQNNFFAFT